MASSELPPSKKKSVPTTICALGDDLLCEVFLRLPSLPTLVRAALTCPSFLRAVRSSPKFRRRFRDLHPAPLLGVFLDIYQPAMPAFVPIRRRSDPDHAAAVRGADVFLTRVPDVDDDRVPEDEDEGEGEDEDEDEGEGDDEDEREGDDEDEGELGADVSLFRVPEAEGEGEGEGDSPTWSMTECRDGYVVLVNQTINQSTRGVAVYDPLTRGLHLLPAPPEEICGDPEDTQVEFHVVTSEEDRRSLRVVCVCKERRKVRVAVFSPDIREWQISPEAARLQLQADDNGTLVNGSVYWARGADIHVLNTATLQFSWIDPPPHMGREGSKIGETSDGKLCVAEATSSTGLFVWVRRADDSGVDKWMRGRPFGMRAIGELELEFVDELPALELDVVAIISGIVYLSIFQPSLPSASGWFLSFCIETKELKKVCPITRSESSYPYVMAWPPVLVGNKVNSLGLKGLD